MRLSRRSDGYGGVSRDTWQESGKTEPDHVGPDTVTPNQKKPLQMPLVKRRRKRLSSRSLK